MTPKPRLSNFNNKYRVLYMEVDGIPLPVGPIDEREVTIIMNQIQDNLISISLIKDNLKYLGSNKIDKINGKDLSTNDFTDQYKNKLDSLLNYDDSKVNQVVNNLQETVSNLAKVSLSGSYNDLTNTPEIPNKVSLLYNDCDWIGTKEELKTLDSISNDITYFIIK